jgi:hypothetical protein
MIKNMFIPLNFVTIDGTIDVDKLDNWLRQLEVYFLCNGLDNGHETLTDVEWVGTPCHFGRHIAIDYIKVEKPQSQGSNIKYC